ncbi:apses-domain-containing protein [Neolentinus lepideus HHB14362 ss-1]|uniref:Apses-domain-containing protein n=1 Tax=Neolentinus lepideus HHB14362 ss-1 TaxID=1314782 RepID=A0A165MQV1_9AGAM|nr:apses-domain-containing protein [Neolentinus lepideus HHB14362 ss-1]
MQVAQRAAGQAPPVKIYNAVYSSVQVYECMVRGIAVMRRRTDSYVNATQILKVAGVDKGRRTKILEKEILPGKHEIVQGGYGKYQGTWIPLERGRDIARQYGVAPLLAPLFDFQPMLNPNTLQNPLQGVRHTASPRPLSAASTFPGMPAGGFQLPPNLAPPPIMPGSALRLLNQGRAQGLFTPSTSSLAGARTGLYQSPGGSLHQIPGSPFSGVQSPTPPPSQQSLKRAYSDMDVGLATQTTTQPSQPALEPSPDIQMADGSRPQSSSSQRNGEDGQSPLKRPRQEHTPPGSQEAVARTQSQNGVFPSQRLASRTVNGVDGPPNSSGAGLVTNGKLPAGPSNQHAARFATKPSVGRNMDPSAPLKDDRRLVIIACICQYDAPGPALEALHEIKPDNPSLSFDPDLVLDDQGHTALHLAASLARLQTVDALIKAGADVHRGNYNGETALMRACLATHNSDMQTFHALVAALHESIHTLDSSRKSVLHHIVALAGVKGRTMAARYYLDQILFWIVQHENGDFRSIVDLQDEHGDTALNIAARVGNRSLVRTFLDIGANRILPNKLGLRPGDFGVEVEELGGGPRAADILSSFRTGPSLPVQKSQDIITDITTMIQGLSNEFSSEIKVKTDQLEATRLHLNVATRELSEQRRQIQEWQQKLGELEQIGHRTRNLQKALVEEDQFDYTGRTDLQGRDARATAGPAFQWRGHNSTMAALGGTVDLSFNLDAEPTIPMSDSPANLIRLRRLKMWHERIETLLEERLSSLRGASAEKAFQCKKIVALCTGIPIDRVETLLEDLLVAFESEAQIVDIGRVSGFMQKVRDGII